MARALATDPEHRYPSGADLAHLCDVSMFGGEQVYIELGCRDVQVERIGCVAHGDSACSWITEWRA